MVSSHDVGQLSAGSCVIHRTLIESLDASTCLLLTYAFVTPTFLSHENAANVSAFDCLLRWDTPTTHHPTVMRVLRAWSKKYPEALPEAENAYNRKMFSQRNAARKRKVSKRIQNHLKRLHVGSIAHG